MYADNSFDQDQGPKNVGPDLDSNCLTLKWYSLNNFSKKLILKKSEDYKKKHTKLPSRQRAR